MLNDLLVAVALLGALMLALELGFRAGIRSAAEADARAAGQVGAVQGAMLGLLGLLLAFSFAAAASRFQERQDLIVAEANAIGTAYQRADLLEEPHRSALRSSLEQYTKHRVELSRRMAERGVSAGDLTEVERLHGQIWNAALEGTRAQPAAAMLVLSSVNEVIDMHATRVGAGKKHLPGVILGLLIACSLLAMGDIGYGSGLGGRRRLSLTGSLAVLVAAALWITIDLDQPRSGLLKLSDEPLESLKLGSPPVSGAPR